MTRLNLDLAASLLKTYTDRIWFKNPKDNTVEANGWKPQENQTVAAKLERNGIIKNRSNVSVASSRDRATEGFPGGVEHSRASIKIEDIDLEQLVNEVGKGTGRGR